MKLYRASDRAVARTGASFSPDVTVAEAYLTNNGFGGATIFEYRVTPRQVLTLWDTPDSLSELGDALGMSSDEVADWEWPSVYAVLENEPGVLKILQDAGFDWVTYDDDFPSREPVAAETWVKVSPGKIVGRVLWGAPHERDREIVARVNRGDGAMNENPPWADRVLRKHWDTLRRRVGAKNMPSPYTAGPGGGGPVPYAELGSGHYGTVYETANPDVVMKITTDVDEARFVVAAMSLDYFPTGIVRYYDIVRLPETYRRHPVFVVWRERAVVVGTLMPGAGTKAFESGPRTLREFRNLLNTFNLLAGQVRNLLKRAGDQAAASLAKAIKAEGTGRIYNAGYALYENTRKWEGNLGAWRGRPQLPRAMPRHEKLARLIRAATVAAEIMANTYGASEVGGALEFYINNGLLLADVHHNNIGQVERADEYDSMVTVITDPGHAVFLDGRYDKVVKHVLDPAKLRRQVTKLRKKPTVTDLVRKAMK